MKPTIIPKDLEHLKQLIRHEVYFIGKNCDLNHIDVSKITDMFQLFAGIQFDGDISKWNVSNVENMYALFQHCPFNGDISLWDVSKVKDMSYMFDCSKFTSDLSHWKPISLETSDYMFNNCKAPEPYWTQFDNQIKRKIAIENYWTEKELKIELEPNYNSEKRIKL